MKPLPKLQNDIGKGRDKVVTQNEVKVKETATHRTVARIDKFDDPKNIIDRLVKSGLFKMHEIIEMFPKAYLGFVEFKGPEPEGNVCLNSGIQGFEKLLASLSSPPTTWSNAAAYLGVGDSSTAAVATQTDLQAAANYAYAGMVGGYPSQASQAVSWQASFGSGVANYAWNEFVVSNASTKGSGVCLNRLVSAQGTKTSGQTWVLTLTITWS